MPPGEASQFAEDDEDPMKIFFLYDRGVRDITLRSSQDKR